jgi:hypothetical protein
MPAFTKNHSFIEEIFEGGHALAADTLKVALSNTAPTPASDTVWSTGVFPAPAAANGYSAGGNTITVSSSAQTTGTYKLVFADSVFTATAGGIGPFRYAIIYNSSKSNKIVGTYDYGSSITLANAGDSLTVDFDPTTGVIQAS